MRKQKYFAGATLLLIIWCTTGYWNSCSQTRNYFFAPPKKLEGTTHLPKIYVITPTYARPVQKADLTRLSHTLRLVPNLHWVVVEDSARQTELVANFLKKCGVNSTHLNAATPLIWKWNTGEPRYKPRGVNQRNTGLEWLRANAGAEEEGVVYFADDDNTYSLEIFEEMRTVKKVGVWPVGLVGGVMVERPEVSENGSVVGYLVGWAPGRLFAVDMAGFAVNLKLILSRPEGKFEYEVVPGHQENVFLKHFVKSLDELEAKADNCTKVYVWHTRTENPALLYELTLKIRGKPRSDLGIEV